MLVQWRFPKVHSASRGTQGKDWALSILVALGIPNVKHFSHLRMFMTSGLL